MDDQSNAAKVPVYQEYMNAMLQVLREHGAPLSIEVLDTLTIRKLDLSPEVLAIAHEGYRGEAHYRMAWARSYLKKGGLLENLKRAEWSLTPKGQSAGTIDPYELTSDVVRIYRSSEDRPGASDDDSELDDELTTARVGTKLRDQLAAILETLAVEGALLSPAEVERCSARFREKFGPEVLANLDGEALLTTLHARKTKDSLVYWLEFKDDDELPAVFGSIAGGSALKFEFYQAADTGQWMSGSGNRQAPISVEQAIEKARAQRDQLVAGTRVLAALGSDPDAIDFARLQDDMTAAAPSLASTSWGHKYFSLLAPRILMPFHSPEYERNQIRKLLKVPGRGHYENARLFVGVAKQLGASLVDLAACLYRRNGRPHRYWRVGTHDDKGSEWDRMLEGQFASVGWADLGDLSALHGPAGREAIRSLLKERYGGEPSALTRSTGQIYNFLREAAIGDVVIAMDGARVRGLGRIKGDYVFTAGDGRFPHRRPVEWLRTGEWKMPELEAMRTTFVELRKDQNIVDIERRLLAMDTRGASLPPALLPSGDVPLPPLSGTLARIDSVLTRKRQVILYGPPGTGKTYWAEKAGEELAARAWFNEIGDRLPASKRVELRTLGAIEMCSFHPAYGYEDFLEGFRPLQTAGPFQFELRDGIFKRLCARAEGSPSKPHYLIIDEINRGDIPRIFGELLTVLEREKRGRTITLPMSGRAFSVPDNVFVIGTMNTADRSIALLDAALRRRFGFVELVPDSTALEGARVGGLPLGPWLDELNRRIVRFVGRDARHLQVGHSYLLHAGAPLADVARFVEVLRDDIFPLLEEYCYEDPQALESILGTGLFQRTRGRFDASLFEPPRHGDLVGALLAAFPEIAVTRQAVEAELNAGQAALDDDVESAADTP